MAAELKTQPTDASVADFIAAVEPAGRRADAATLAALLSDVTGEPAVMWGPSIVGFGRYTYVNSTRKPADWPIIGFSPRKANLTVYIMPGFSGYADLLGRLGKHKASVSCLYLNRLSDIDLDVLREMATRSVGWMRERYPIGR
ncbi:MAG: DUF1801 domain-containing protein [Phenylobacterium sp.]|uniref:DUF1801 domain-containing protein n=1 Tax=Brevundimonas sp. TaxID=1871086 RepID=UPI002737FA67|nr:DUF1801 domain-containing protein [Brevundimonas sp.]MDP3801096.1 DUF1801 domain-containing protein [Brevundimonas sp.]MDZ4371558.1 DUF1801 domain-containing protein [Phenylobacterium sp.]